MQAVGYLSNYFFVDVLKCYYIHIFYFFNVMDLMVIKRTKRNLGGKLTLSYPIGHLVLHKVN